MDVLPMPLVVPSESARLKLGVTKVKRLKKRSEERKLEDIPENEGSETIRSLETAKVRRRLDGKKLKAQLSEAVKMNEDLTQAIESKNSEIADLKRSVDSLNDVLNSVPIEELRCNSSIASNKLMDLGRKNRSLQVQLEQTKSRLSKKECDIQKLEREVKNYEAKIEELTNPKTKTGNNLDDLQAKLSALQQKFFEARNKNTELQNQLKLAQKLLTQEIGENFSINNWTALHTMQSNWRGRAQQILQLQQREKELREKLEQYEQQSIGLPPNFGMGDGSAILIPTRRSEGGGGRKSSPKSQNSRLTLPSMSAPVFERFPESRRNQAQHRAKVESLEKEINDLKENLGQANSKILALKVRNKTLSDELNKWRTNYSTQQQMEEYNSIMHSSSLMDKLNKQKMQYEGQMNDLRLEYEKASKDREDALFREQAIQTKFEEAQDLLTNKDEVIEELSESLKKAETDLKALSDGFLFACRDLRKEEFIAVLDGLEAEKNDLLKLNTTLNERLTSERAKTDTLSDSYSKSKIKISRLEAKIRELEKEIENLTEKKKRAQRIADYATSVTNLQTGRSVTSFTFENSNLQIPDLSITSRSVSNADLKLAEVQNHLELANEKIVMLTEKITYLTEEKEKDTKMFESTISNTKATLLETILEHKTEIKRPMSAIPTDRSAVTINDNLIIADIEFSG